MLHGVLLCMADLLIVRKDEISSIQEILYNLQEWVFLKVCLFKWEFWYSWEQVFNCLFTRQHAYSPKSSVMMCSHKLVKSHFTWAPSVFLPVVCSVCRNWAPSSQREAAAAKTWVHKVQKLNIQVKVQVLAQKEYSTSRSTLTFLFAQGKVLKYKL